MSDIYKLKSQFCECNLRHNMVHFCSSFTLPIRNEFDINYVKRWTFFCKFYILSIKFNYAASFSQLKLQSWFHPSAGSFDLWATFLLVFLCLRLFHISFICPQEVFDPVKCKARFLFDDFVAVYWYHTQCFAMFLVAEVFTLIVVITKAIACMWKCFRLVVFSCLCPFWSFFYPRLKCLSGSRSSPNFVTNEKSSDHLVYQLHFVSPSLKLFYTCNEAVWFWEQSHLSWKVPPFYWKYSLLPSWDKFETNMLRICAYLFLTHSKLTPSQAFLALKSAVVSSNWSSPSFQTRQSSTLLFGLDVFQKLNYYYGITTNINIFLID